MCCEERIKEKSGGLLDDHDHNNYRDTSTIGDPRAADNVPFGRGEAVEQEGALELISNMNDRFAKAVALSHLMTDAERHYALKVDLLLRRYIKLAYRKP
jgi:hypothetical protein